MRFVVDEVTLEQVSSEFFSFLLLNVFLSLFHTVLTITNPMRCDISYQAAHYFTLFPKWGASSLTRQFAGLGVKLVQFPLEHREKSPRQRSDNYV
jgi:hypothetical protein